MTQQSHESDAERYPTRTFSVADPRTFEGDPYEAASRGVKQLDGVLAVAEALFPATLKMARNADLERAFAYGQDPQGAEWPNTPVGKKYVAFEEQLAEMRKTLAVLAKAAAFNPKAAE